MNKDTLIVSMTSWPPRIKDVVPAWEALIKQKTDDMNVHFVLVLSTEEFPYKGRHLPRKLLKLDIEILWTDRNTRSHKKLMPTLRKYPNNPIVVIDDDVCQKDGWLRTMIEDHRKFPEDIIYGQSTSTVYLDKNDEIKELRSGRCYQVPGNVALTQKPASGASGTLFPAGTFTDPRFFDEDLMMRLSPSCDETWQFVFAIIANKRLRALSKHNIPILNKTNQDVALFNTNKEVINKIHKDISDVIPEYKPALKKRSGLVVVSLESRGDRILKLAPTINSLINQTKKPLKIVLNITKEDERFLNKTIMSFVKSGILDVYVVPVDLKSHNKYVYTMLRYNDALTLVVNDNRIYPENMIEKYYESYLNDPNNAIASDIRVISKDNDSNVLPFEKWDIKKLEEESVSEDYVAMSNGGILFPPSCISQLFNIQHIKSFIEESDFYIKHLLCSLKFNISKINIGNIEYNKELDELNYNLDAINKVILKLGLYDKQ